MIIKKPATIISKRETVISGPDTVMSGLHIIIDISDAIISVVETAISATDTPISRADIVNCAFDTSFFAAEMDRGVPFEPCGCYYDREQPPAVVWIDRGEGRTQKRR